MYTNNRRFEWDDDKARLNVLKHSIDFVEATTAFDDPDGRIADDPTHSKQERRYWLIGKTVFGRLIMIVFTPRPGPITRLISARPASREERVLYEKNR